MRWLVIAIMISGRVALAQAPGDTLPRPVAHKTVVRALLVSWGATTVPLMVSGIGTLIEPAGVPGATLGAIGIAGIVFGPSAGQWYAGRAVTPGLVMRAAGVGGILALAIAEPHLDSTAIVFALAGGLGLLATGAIWDVVTLPRAVHHFNDAHELHLVPLGTGFAIAGAF